MNILPNKQVLWWALPHSNNKVIYKLLLATDTVLSFKHDTFDIGYNVLNLKPGVPAVAKDYPIICNISNPYMRMHCAWKEACLKKYKFLPTLKQWFNVNHSKTKPGLGSETDLNVTAASLLDTAKSIYNKTPDYFIRSDNLKQDIKSISVLQSPLLTDVVIDYFIENVASNEKNVFLNGISAGKISSTNEIDIFNDWKAYYDQELADSVYTLLEADFIKFNFDRDSWKQ